MSIYIMSITIHSRYSPPPKVSIKFTNPSLTEQCHKSDCDIDVILKRYQQTGFLVNPLEQTDRTPMFGDFSDMEGYQELQNRMISIGEHFDSLPSRIRLMFGNDVGNYLQAMNDPQRTEELIGLGLLKRTQAQENDAVNAPLLHPEKELVTDVSGEGSTQQKIDPIS